MKKIYLIILTLFISTMMYSQPWNQNLPKSKSEQELTLFDYQKAFNEYWAPYKIENGKYVDKNGN